MFSESITTHIGAAFLVLGISSLFLKIDDTFLIGCAASVLFFAIADAYAEIAKNAKAGLIVGIRYIGVISFIVAPFWMKNFGIKEQVTPTQVQNLPQSKHLPVDQ